MSGGVGDLRAFPRKSNLVWDTVIVSLASCSGGWMTLRIESNEMLLCLWK